MKNYEKSSLSTSKIILYSLCYDYPFVKKYKEDIESYKCATTRFKLLVDKLLIDLELETKIEYHGFVGASEYLDLNKARIGQQNYEYVSKRYFYSINTSN